MRDRTSDKEKFFIATSHDLQVTGNLEKAQQTCEAWVETYPREVACHAMLGGEIYPSSAKYEKAVEEGRKAVELDPDFPFGYYVLAFGYEYGNHLREAENILDAAAKRKLEFPGLLVQRYDIAFLKGDATEMERAATLGQGNPGAEDWTYDDETFALAYSGHLQQAMRMSQRAANLAPQSSQSEEAALFETGAALWEGLFGNAPAARQSATAALKLSMNRDVEYGAAFALALSGDSLRSQTLANDLEGRFPEDTSVKFSYLPSLRALRALSYRQPSKAIELLQTAIPYELGAPRSSIYGFCGALDPIYVRGEAYLALHHDVEATVEFQKILDHRGVVVSDPIGALAHLQLGRAYARQGDTSKAKTAYQYFLTLWNDADAGHPHPEGGQGQGGVWEAGMTLFPNGESPDACPAPPLPRRPLIPRAFQQQRRNAKRLL